MGQSGSSHALNRNAAASGCAAGNAQRVALSSVALQQGLTEGRNDALSFGRIYSIVYQEGCSLYAFEGGLVTILYLT